MPIPSDPRLDELRLLADPPADAVLTRLIDEQGPDEARRLFDELIRNLDMPTGELLPAAAALMEDTARLPDWAEPGQVRLAHDLFLDHGPKFLLVLYFKSLPLLYLDAKGAPVLIKTSRLTNEDRSLRIFARRIAETGQFLVDTMTPGELQPGGRGITAIQKVRLIHAAIRQFIPPDGWDEVALGKPVNQEDMALTLMTFSVALTEAMGQFGIELTDEQREAYLHAWKAVGLNLGVMPELLPADHAEGVALLNKILDRHAAESEAGKLLTEALLDFSREHFPQKELRQTPESLIRYFLGPERAQMLGIQPNYGCLAWLIPEVLRSAFSLGERLEDKAGEPLRLLLDRLSRRTTLAMVNYFNVYKGRPFSIPEQVKEAWFGVK